MIALTAPPVDLVDGHVTIDLSGPLRDLLCDLATAMHTNTALGLALDDLDTALTDAAAGPDPDVWSSPESLERAVCAAQDAVLRLLGDAALLRMTPQVAHLCATALLQAAHPASTRLAG
jgi:hypothetical protein